MLNGEFKLSDTPCLAYNNRGLLYADSFSVELRGNSSKAYLFQFFYDYIIKMMGIFKMECPLNLEYKLLATDLNLLLQKNRIYKEFTSTITIFRNSSSSKLAINNSVSILISVEALTKEQYIINEDGIIISIHNDYHIPDYYYTDYLLPKHLEFIYPIPELIINKTEDIILTDKNGNICKSILSNIYFVKDNLIIVPRRVIKNDTLIFHNFILLIFENLQFKIETREVIESDLYTFDEIFLADIIRGIRWIKGYKDKRYFNKTSRTIIKEINTILQEN